MPPIPPAPHFPSPYARPSAAPRLAQRIRRPDGAQIAFFVYGKETETHEDVHTNASADVDAPEGRVANITNVSDGDTVNTANGEGQHAGYAACPVLFLHGNGEEHGIFGPQIDAVVNAGGIAVGIDSRAQGKSTRGVAHLTYDLMAEDALAVLDELHITRAHVLGFSDGAIEALLLARDHPERVASAVVIGANLTPGGVDNTDFPMAEIAAQNEAWAEWLQTLGAVDTVDGKATDSPAMSSQTGIPSTEPEPIEPVNIDPTLLSPPEEEARNTADLMRLMMVEPHITPASLSAISCPVAVVAGEFDVILPDETLAIKQAIPTAELFIVPDCGHSLPKHAPAAVTGILFHTTRRVRPALTDRS